MSASASPPRRRIAVIGGGYSGMAAAVEASLGGALVVVYETGKILGGRARRVELREGSLDNGQHILSGAYTTLLGLMDVVGVGAKAVERVPLSLQMPPHFGMRAPLLPAPLHTAFALLTARGLTLGDRFRAVRMMHALKSARWQVAPGSTVRTLLEAHRQSDRLVNYLWRPLTVSALNTPIESACAQVFANVLRDALAGEREASDLLLPRVDLSALFPEPAAAWLRTRGADVRLSTRVTDIAPSNDGDAGVLIASTGGNESTTERFDAAIVAIAPQQLSAFPSIFAPNSAPVFDFEPITTIYLGYANAARYRLSPTMLGQTDGLVHWFFDRRALTVGGVSKSDELIIAAVISASRTAAERPTAELVAQAHQELTTHLPGLPAPAWSKVITEKFATFACTPSVVRPSSPTSLSRVFLAGDFVDNPYPATLEGAVRNGVAAARLALATDFGHTPS